MQFDDSDLDTKFDIEKQSREVETMAKCTCSLFINDNGIGMCQKPLMNTSTPICYVTEPSNCNDLLFDEEEKKYFSEEACLKIFGKNYFLLSLDQCCCIKSVKQIIIKLKSIFHLCR